MLSCMILLTIELDTCAQLRTHTHHRAVNICAQARLHVLVYDSIRNLNLMLTHITRRAFNKCLRENLNSLVAKYMQARVSHYEHIGY